MIDPTAGPDHINRLSKLFAEKKNDIGNKLIKASNSLLSLLIESQSIDSLGKIKNISKQLTTLMIIGEEGTKQQRSNILTPQEEDVLSDKLTQLQDRLDGEGLDLKKLSEELNELLDNHLNHRCAVIRTLIEIEYLISFDPPQGRNAIHSEEIEGFSNRIIDKISSLSNLEITHLTHILTNLKNIARDPHTTASHIIENLKQIADQLEQLS